MARRARPQVISMTDPDRRTHEPDRTTVVGDARRTTEEIEDLTDLDEVADRGLWTRKYAVHRDEHIADDVERQREQTEG
jgi:hypothetical protein